jgi:SCY1-like protein 1
MAFDDGGEPDFAGWLAAQSKAKAKKPFPKRLDRAAPTKDSPIRSPKPTVSGTGTTLRAKAALQPTRKIDIKPKEESTEDDGWGDAWD